MLTQSPVDNVELVRTGVLVDSTMTTNVDGGDSPHSYSGSNNAWNFEEFNRNFEVKIHRLSRHSIEFDLVGVDASVANAFRRILIAEIPTMAIERIYVMNNTSIIQDEVLSQRLGLIPIKAPPQAFDYKIGDDSPTDLNTLVFKLQVKCKHNPDAAEDETDPCRKYINSQVFSLDLIWKPQGDQAERFANYLNRPVHDDIFIAKLRPGQEIDMELHCTKGLGKEHAKWSPVATATFRLLPEINILQPILGDDAIKFKHCFPDGVVALAKNEHGETMAKIVHPRKDTVARAVLRHKEFENKVQFSRARNHYIFNVETTGIIPPQDLFPMAVNVLLEKISLLQLALDRLVSVTTCIPFV